MTPNPALPPEEGKGSLSRCTRPPLNPCGGKYTLEMLKQNGGFQEKTARAMGVGLTTLKRWLKKWDVKPENFKG